MSTTRAEWEQDLGRAADMRPKHERESAEQYVREVMTQLARLQHETEQRTITETEDTETAMATPIQRSDPVTYYPNTLPPDVKWSTPPVQIKTQRTRSFTETYDMGLNLARVAADSFEEQTGQTMNQLTMAELAVKIAKMLENW